MFGNAQNKMFGNAQKRNRRTGTRLTSDQREILEEEFINNQHPDIHERRRIADRIGLTEGRVQVRMISRYHI